MTDDQETDHITRQAAALDDPRLCRDSGGVSDAQDEALKRRLESLLRELITDQSCGEWGEDTIEADVQTFLPRIMGTVADLARPSQAEDERVARALQQGIDLIVGDLTGSEWKRACLDFVANARAALAAMDTPKGGGGDE